MNVERLIFLLSGMDPKSEVFTEGCDCVEEAVGISVPTEESFYGQNGKKSVMIRRTSGACYDAEGEIIR